MYKVEREDGKGGERMLHRNNLLHLGSSLADEVKEPDKTKSSVDSEGLTNCSTRATPTPAPRSLKKLPTPKHRNKKVERETEKRKMIGCLLLQKRQIIVQIRYQKLMMN